MWKMPGRRRQLIPLTPTRCLLMYTTAVHYTRFDSQIHVCTTDVCHKEGCEACKYLVFYSTIL